MAMSNRAPRGRPTGPTQQQAGAFVGAEMAMQPEALQRVKRGGVDLDADSNNFPASQYPWSAMEDSQMQLKAAVVGGENFTAKPVDVQYTLGPEDFAYYKSKQDAEEFAAFERWVQLQFDFKSPAEVDRFAKMFPEYFERRLAVLKNVSDANLRYAQIQLTGAQSADDYLYLWMAQSNRIPLITGALWEPSKWFTSDSASAKLAIFNPFKYFMTTKDIEMPHIPSTNFFNPGVPLKSTDQGYAVASNLIKMGAADESKAGSTGVPNLFSMSSTFAKPRIRQQ